MTASWQLAAILLVPAVGTAAIVLPVLVWGCRSARAGYRPSAAAGAGGAENVAAVASAAALGVTAAASATALRRALRSRRAKPLRAAHCSIVAAASSAAAACVAIARLRWTGDEDDEGDTEEAAAALSSAAGGARSSTPRAGLDRFFRAFRSARAAAPRTEHCSVVAASADLAASAAAARFRFLSSERATAVRRVH